MNETYRIRIDIDNLRRNLSAANRWMFTAEDVHDWLASMNFVRSGSEWLADGTALDRLEPEEILFRTPAATRTLEKCAS